jgi:hypothetical protein
MIPLGATLEATNVEIALGVLGIISALIGHHFVLKKYIRDVAGVREQQTTEIGGQPISIKRHAEYVERDSYHKHCEINRLEHTRIEARVAAVEARREQDKEEIITAGNARAEGTNRRIEALIEKVGQLNGQMAEIAKRV